jgi:hypothetical protein
MSGVQWNERNAAAAGDPLPAGARSGRILARQAGCTRRAGLARDRAGSLKALLPFLVVAEVIEAPPFDLRCRSVGSDVVDAYGYDFTGLNLSDDGVRINRLLGIEDWGALRGLGPSPTLESVWQFEPL